MIVTTTAIVRGFSCGHLEFVDRIELRAVIEAASINVDTAALFARAEEHMSKLDLTMPFMLEIEFLDEPDQQKRFFRFGTDPGEMVIPIPINITKD